MTVNATDPVEADRRSRRFAQSEFEHPVVVVAGAGTGKTALLVSRVVAWCAGPGWQRHAETGLDDCAVARRVIERVVAITFTEAAAAEMAHKIGTAFLALACGEKPVGWDPEPGLLPDESEEEKRRALALSEESHRLVVSTIHAYCQRLLSTYPLESGLHPRFEVDADGSRIRDLVEEALEETLRELGGAAGGSWQQLAAEGVAPATIVDAVCALVEAGVEPEWLARDPFDDAGAPVLAARLRCASDTFRGLVGDRLAGVRGEVSVLTGGVGEQVAAGLPPVGDEVSMLDLVGVAAAVDPRAIERLRKWSRLGFTDGEGAAFEDIGEEVAPASGELAAVLAPLADPHREGLAAARAVLSPLLAAVQERRRAEGLVTFSDQLRAAANLLADSPGVRSEVVRGIDHLLVDEFQDTDDVQCRLVEMLALADEPPRRPSLFIVGDPKQSIYAWRSADLAAYHRFVRRVLEAGGKTVDLVQNFRSVTPILDEVERLVAPVMERETGIQPAFQALEATEGRRGVAGVDASGWKTVEHWVAWPDGPDGVAPEKGNADNGTSALEARAIAADISRLHSESVIGRWGEVAVLLRVTTAQEVLLEALREAGVPYEVARERDYYRQREVVELAALVRTVLEPADVLALLTVLRSDVVGVPDAALAPLWRAGLPARMAGLTGPDRAVIDAVDASVEAARVATPADAPGIGEVPGWPDAVRAAAATIAELRQSLRCDPPDVFVEKIRTLWLAEVTAAGRYLGGFRRARIERFLADLEATLVTGEKGGADLARFLRLAVSEGGESRVPTPPDLEVDAVHVMTIHKAKGLDFSHVYVAQIHKGGRGGGRRAAAEVRTFDGMPEYRLFGWSSPGFASAEWESERKTRAELVRLLYVATTRAKNRLVLSGGWRAPGQHKSPKAATTFADLVSRRLDTDAVGAQIGLAAERAAGDAPHLMRVMPAFADIAVEAEPVRRVGESVEGIEERLQRAQDLAAARAASVHRMAQPVFRSASAEAHDRLRSAEAEEVESVGEGPSDRRAAMALGTAVHSMMEDLDLDAALRPQVAGHRDRILSELAPFDDAKTRAENLMTRLAEGSCLTRLEAIADRVLARELPVMLWSEEPGAAGAVVSGIVDLVYRDPEDDRVVVADYKTDHVEGEEAIAERAEVYEPQVRTYARALREALTLDHEPRVELWFLAADHIVRF